MGVSILVRKINQRDRYLLFLLSPLAETENSENIMCNSLFSYMHMHTHTHTQSQFFSTETSSSMPCYSSCSHPKSKQYYFRFRMFRGKKIEKKNKKNNSKNLHIRKNGFNPSSELKEIYYTQVLKRNQNCLIIWKLHFLTITYLTYGKEKAKT